MSERKLQTPLAVGQIVGIHGLRGEMKVNVLTDFDDRFAPDALLWVEGETSPRSVVSARWHKRSLLLHLAGLDSRTVLEPLRQRYLFIERSQAAPLETDEYYEDELVGLQVRTEAGQVLGVLTEVLWTGANDVYVIQGDWGEVLLPAIAEVVQNVDLQHEQMVVRLLPGLIPALDAESSSRLAPGE